MKLTEWQEDCLMMLSTMNSANSQTFGEAHALTYGLILSELGEEAGRAATVQAIRTLSWRPAPAELRAMAATLASPLPPVGVLWGEFWHKAIHAAYSQPNWTHPILSDIAASLGGWLNVRENYWPDSDPYQIDALHRRFDTAAEGCVAQWRESVTQQFAFPTEERDPRFFPVTRPFVAPKSLPPGSSENEAFPSLSDIAEHAPDEVRAQIRSLRRLLEG